MLKILPLLFTLNIYSETINHNFLIEIRPNDNYLKVTDKIFLNSKKIKEIFFLNRNLEIQNIMGAEIKELNSAELKNYDQEELPTHAKAYLIISSKAIDSLTLEYSGKIKNEFKEIAQEYSRAFKEIDGLISKEGCYLSGNSYYYPTFKNKLLSFKMSVKLPEEYTAVTQGERLIQKKNYSVWEEKNPQDEITLICSKFKEYSIKDGDKIYYAFLQKDDNDLAEKYLENTKKYIRFYSTLIGPYLYKKFALVENFWETGYGMPSFTLLGSKVIRLPFIISSSYPHEILHNWWGNGVFVNYEKGNWCEGLTVYLADYLIKENNNKAREYRMNILQKYADYVSDKKDFPIKNFISRHSSTQEAIGYGKTMMFFHMLRLRLGNERFIKALKHFYTQNKFKKADFDDLRKSFEQISGLDLKEFFEQWINKTGAMELKLKEVSLENRNDKYYVNFIVEELSQNNYKKVKIPVVIRTQNNTIKDYVLLENKSQKFQLSLNEEPLSIRIDPDFEVFRKLEPNETPITLSRILGAENPLIILPSENKEKWEKLALAWQFDKTNIPQLKIDNELQNLPDRAIWVLGLENKFSSQINNFLTKLGANINEKFFLISDENFDLSSTTIVFTIPNPENNSKPISYILSQNTHKIDTLAAKLPHYGKYSYLIFDENLNILKSGLWEIKDSSLKFKFTEIESDYKKIERSLVNFPSFFSEYNIQKHLKSLAKEISERFPDTKGFNKAKNYIISELKKYGLKPFQNNYSQKFEFIYNGKKIKTENILAKLEGKNKKDEYLILSAHYDHLKKDKTNFYPGANDNASGVSLLLELAKYYSKKPQERTIIFAFFSAEEEAREGSKHFISNFPKEKINKINACINFDTIGRLNGRDILILNSNSSEKWQYILRGSAVATQINYKTVKEKLNASDDFTFIETGIPAIQFFDGGDINYHKPSDTIETIDINGILKIGELSKEIIEYLAGNSELLKRIPNFKNSISEQSKKRKVSTGLVPDFSFEGNGVMVQETIKDSPLYKAGLKKGDIISKINSKPVKDLKEYSDILKEFNAGEKIFITYTSDGIEKNVEIILSSTPE